MAELFDLVRCGGYVIPARDGRRLIQDKEDPFHGWFVEGRDKTVLQDVFYRGERLEKTYHIYVERPFRGVIVGYRDILFRAVLQADTGTSGTDDEEDIPFGEELPFGSEERSGERIPLISRVDEAFVRCAVVYYSNCRKHYVPLEHIIEKEERT
ncbi:MAG: hypothetical protein E7426_03410 [Ruminococcaceae bacterium]|nr:hypothetical protein [Oscillospiraceae bacterium]